MARTPLGRNSSLAGLDPRLNRSEISSRDSFLGGASCRPEEEAEEEGGMRGRPWPARRPPPVPTDAQLQNQT